jgi:hypothetical protein
MRPVAATLAVVAALTGAGCGGVPSDPGLSAEMQVSGGQFTLGPLPPASGGPAVVSLALLSNTAHAGEIEAPLSGALGPSATAAAIGLAGDSGYWIVPAGLPSVAAPSYPTFGVTLSFSPTLAAGTYSLVVQAADAGGSFGAPMPSPLTVAGPPAITGALVVTLRWDTESDLDLHVVDPEGIEIWRGDKVPSGTTGDLDVDSNAQCVIDGRRQEDVIFPAGPPSGSYRVLVDTFSLCAASDALWTVEARLEGQLAGSATGESTFTDTEGTHDRGAGVLALTFDVP